jgi:hypothetical protein
MLLNFKCVLFCFNDGYYSCVIVMVSVEHLTVFIGKQFSGPRK